MSNYQDYIKDFPLRCREVLDRFREPSKLMEREVTFMLSIATTGFVVPFERLRVDEYMNPNHQLANPRREGGAMAHLIQLMDEPFLSSRLAAGTGDDWMYFKRPVCPDDVPEAWEEMREARSRMKGNKQCKSVLKLIRNALAHGNIFTTGHNIRQLVFLSNVYEHPGLFNVLVVSPENFYRFLLNWFDFLNEVPMPRGIDHGIYAY